MRLSVHGVHRDGGHAEALARSIAQPQWRARALVVLVRAYARDAERRDAEPAACCTVGPMRFATFNVLHGRPTENGRPLPFPAAAAEPLAEAVASTDADVLALQEVDRFQERSGQADQAAIAARRVGARDWRYASALHGRSVPDRGWVLDLAQPGLRVYGPQEAAARSGGPSHGIALLSRVPVLAWRARRLPAAPCACRCGWSGGRGSPWCPISRVPYWPRSCRARAVLSPRWRRTCRSSRAGTRSS
ncbi:endonuclease/exonuclease/phosphatase family protein [Planobispora rosea]|uniref:endonuclease/exonuclease/phosphatase family protein n=1 Tax=Planobispora rosea TaxID=35762 RepID=UPI000AC678D5|nr:endonuclease/exonuclease/phosphatase family protein [Planobispora rosea]